MSKKKKTDTIALTNRVTPKYDSHQLADINGEPYEVRIYKKGGELAPGVMYYRVSDFLIVGDFAVVQEIVELLEQMEETHLALDELVEEGLLEEELADV